LGIQQPIKSSISFRTPTGEDEPLVQRCGSPLTTAAGADTNRGRCSFDHIAEPYIFISDEPRKPDTSRFGARSVARLYSILFRFQCLHGAFVSGRLVQSVKVQMLTRRPLQNTS
jgi:hypothetical protein